MRITDLSSDLAAAGGARIAGIRSRMPLLAETRRRFAEQRPFAGLRIGASVHLAPKTAVLLETLAAGGAEIVGTGNHGSTQDDIVAALRAQGLTIRGRPDDSLEQHLGNVEAVLDSHPRILLDNGADLAAGAAAAPETCVAVPRRPRRAPAPHRTRRAGPLSPCS